jgi:hypothetical protein
MLLRLLLAAVMISTIARAQDVHVCVSPDVKTGIESTTEYPTIQMALDHHPSPASTPIARSCLSQWRLHVRGS